MRKKVEIMTGTPHCLQAKGERSVKVALDPPSACKSRTILLLQLRTRVVPLDV